MLIVLLDPNYLRSCDFLEKMWNSPKDIDYNSVGILSEKQLNSANDALCVLDFF